MADKSLISLHGGHSKEFCSHADGLLEDMIQRYIALGFTRVGITEHIPPSADAFVYPDEKRLGLSVPDLDRRFESYFKNLRRLQEKYADRIRIFAGMETESYTGCEAHVRNLIRRFGPDYIVGSVHHTDDFCFDYDREAYAAAVARYGSHEALYERYFDTQQDMILALKPFVVGHFDLVRIYDPDYEKRLSLPAVKQKIIRNLELIRSLDLVLDFNLRPLARGEKEPYVAPWILKTAVQMGIRAIPGDDAHRVDEAGAHVALAVRILKEAGMNTDWPDPVLLTGRSPLITDGSGKT